MAKDFATNVIPKQIAIDMLREYELVTSIIGYTELSLQEIQELTEALQ